MLPGKFRKTISGIYGMLQAPVLKRGEFRVLSKSAMKIFVKMANI